MSCIVLIHGREALPVRAIPLIASFPADDVALSFARKQTGFERLGNLVAHHLAADGSIGDLLPREWDRVEDSLAALTLELETKDPGRVLARPEWTIRSVLCLPAGVFVWRDEFEAAYAANLGRGLFMRGQRPGERDINYIAWVPPELSAAIFEGLPAFAVKPKPEAMALEMVPEEHEIE
ncbi:MAG: hypothetical protein LBR88_09145, partial [Zoogloeaceae bacterium]|nr:hypothetical protein [Zoogloeaceae bacterium]